MENMKEFREPILTCLTGSHLYGLNDETSDKDYKVFTKPTFEDLYNGVKITNYSVTKEVDHTWYDIRRLPELLIKSNMVFYEMLYSPKVQYDAVEFPEIAEIFSLRDEIVKSNLPRLWESINGTHKQRLDKMHKGTDGTQHLVDKFGYNTKEMMHTIRNLHTAILFSCSGYTNFDSIIKCGESARKYYMAIKNGEFSKVVNDAIIVGLYKDFLSLKDNYKSQPINTELNEHLNELTMKIVKRCIVN